MKKRSVRLVSILLAIIFLFSLVTTAGASNFSDVGGSTEDAFADAIAYMTANAYMNGVSATKFEPDAPTTRGMVATVLYRFCGGSKPYLCNFSDVEASDWYYPGVSWAARKGIMIGTSATKFEPDKIITREQLMTTLYRFAQFYHKPVDTADRISLCSDHGAVSGYAVPALNWAANTGLLLLENPKSALYPKAVQDRKWFALSMSRFSKEIIGAQDTGVDNPFSRGKAVLELAVNSAVSVVNAEGAALEFAGGEYSGTMEVESAAFTVSDDPDCRLYVPDSRWIQVTIHSGCSRAEYAGKDVFSNVDGRGVERITFYQDGRIELEGAQMECQVTGNIDTAGFNLVKFIGTCTGKASFRFDAERVFVDSDCNTWNLRLAAEDHDWVSDVITGLSEHAEVRFHNDGTQEGYCSVS